ncbi:MAG: nitrogenase component 1 [Desulfovibrio sp.]|nr:nitrogenase component 1 [Desulfovibrio sp.]
MRNAAAFLPSYASDTSGVASALYELGGMTVVHDASGCNSTYSTFDEPRWYDHPSFVFISGLTEMDAIFGQDERVIEDIVLAAKRLKPLFISICTSPMPVLLGSDIPAIATIIETRTGIPTFAIRTNGMNSYLAGASRAWEAIVRRFAEKEEKHGKPSANILGLTPLDFGMTGVGHSIGAWLEHEGFSVNATLAMGNNDSLSSVRALSKAHVNLVVSGCAMASAELLQERFGIPYVVGLPVGAFSETLSKALKRAVRHCESSPLSVDGLLEEKEDGTVIIGEGVFAASLAKALPGTSPASIHVPLEPLGLLNASDERLGLEDETKTEKAMAHAGLVIADPLYKRVAKRGTPFLSLPHPAFSGRMYARHVPVLTDKDLNAWIREALPC